MNDRQYPRSARVNEVVREVLAEELELLSDPRLMLVTITGVEVSPDLKHARVFYSALDELGRGDETPVTGAPPTQEEGDPTANALESARRHLQAALGRQVRLKYVPRLHFERDPGVAQGRRIDDIIRHLHDEDAGPDDPRTGGGEQG